MSFKVVFDWGERSRRLQSRSDLRFKQTTPSFWLMPASPPVHVGVVQPQDVASWDAAATVAIPITTDLKAQTATADVPDDLTFVRLDFDLVASVGAHSATVLSFKQLFLVSSAPSSLGIAVSTALMPAQYSIEDTILVRSSSGPKPQKGPSPTGRRRAIGMHPLLSPSSGTKIAINAEFVDATLLWWKVHPDTTWGWYRHPDVAGRHEHMRVLAWTGGGNPMVWFAVVPDALVSGSNAAASGSPKEQPAANIVFFRPPAGSNSSPYEPTAAGFASAIHDVKSVRVLSRYLLSPVSDATYKSLKASGVRTAELLADQVQPVKASPLSPTDPMDMMRLIEDNKSRPEAFTDGFANAFRPVGLETSLNRTGVPHLLLLPLGFDAGRVGNTRGGYEAAQLSGLADTVASALSTLMSGNAIARDTTTMPVGRQLWAGAFSGAHNALWESLKTNAADIRRIISIDGNTLKDEGIPAMREAAAIRKQANRPFALDAFVVITPNVTGDPKGLSDELDRALRKLHPETRVTVLPAFDKRAVYWQLQPQPPAIPNLYFRYLLAKWDVPMKSPPSAFPAKTLLDLSGDRPRRWDLLFFHELAMFGGELLQPLGSASPGVRTFFEMALGATDPRPAL